jgi:hypothetical protein
MGEAPLSTERVLLIFSQPLPEALVAEIHQLLSNADITIYQSKVREGIPVPVGKSNNWKMVLGTY